MVRALPVLAVSAVLALGGCRADTIRTTSEPTSSTIEPSPSSTTADGPSTSGRKTSPTTAKSSAGSSTTAGSGASTTGGSSGGGSSSGVVLGGSSLGPTSLGTAADEAVAAMRKALGAPSRDLKDPGAACPGPDRLVSWGRFSLYFSGGKLAGWGYDSKPPGPPNLSTPSGITIGSTVATLRRVYGTKIEIHPEESPFPAGFRVSVNGRDLTGTLTGTRDSDTTTSLAYGVSCGE